MKKLENNLSLDQTQYLLGPRAIRDRAAVLYKLVEDGGGQFSINLSKLPEVGDLVIDVIKNNYPDLEIPYHSRWNHFSAGGIDRVLEFEKLIKKNDAKEQIRQKIDLVVTSVLLDAGAGAKWKYFEGPEKLEYCRSEGLAVASYHMFLASTFGEGLTATGKQLSKITPLDIAEAFQVSDDNPLAGLEGRAHLIQKLGTCLLEQEHYFPGARPGNMIDFLEAEHGLEISASQILEVVLKGFGGIWPGRFNSNGLNLGDCWHHPLLGESVVFESLIPFHKLSQWLCYSLIGPIRDAGFTVSEVDLLTGLPEYRNGGLLIDSGLIEVKDKSLLGQSHSPGSPLIVEWRALTIHLLDIIGDYVREKLGKPVEEFPLVKILEGGTWWAGRKLAADLRHEGEPPLKIKSDGTVF
ncbi:MAG: URC4/urg3 family protein [Halobacteriovoraceae bacterium]|jgi:hypothetical protein|nr:URC4/urg3 family protein [Halobacteriovoraceae bacterium]MBT5094702.1 URC4/urg3 family protein [Halobacteriovoraceae bacterium]